jgi:puromycin-sensitive aminopeptidase
VPEVLYYKAYMKKSVRLSLDIIPSRYKLELAPDLETFTFAGKEIIDVEVKKDTKTITLHSKDIDIETAKVIQGKNINFAKKIVYDKSAETATFVFDTNILKGRAKLSLVFNGIISESLRGLYRSKYVLNGETKHLATTQFEATDARRAFPCFDEPAHKAVFDVSLIVQTNHTAISNTMPVSIHEHSAGYKIVTFAPSPRMSTYLLAFIIGEFEYIERDGVRIFTTADKSHHAQFALDVAIKCLKFYNDYFGIPYPLPILDMIAIPDFESAAMENWGAITYRETALLVDEEHTSLSNKQWAATVIAHEIAHQWFGNLVTMHWWTDLWLNEGFAEFIQNVALDHIFPHWHVWDLNLADGRHATAMKLDSLINSHPIQVEVHHPDEISEVFDMISYAKGSAIIKQLQEYLGPEVFRDGLRHYLKKHSYKNTKTADLWQSFEKVSKKPVGKIMHNWTMKEGYPLVTISSPKQGLGERYVATQERFFSSRISAKKSQKNKKSTLWQIPFSYESNGEIHKELLTKKSAPLLGTSIGKVNLKETSFIRVKYDTETLSRLRTEIEKRTLSVADRLGVIRDLFALAEAGYMHTNEALEFSLVYRNETEYIVWAEIAAGVNKVYNIIVSEEYKNTYKKYVLSLFSPLAKQMSWNKKDSEDHSHTFLRNLALAQAGMYGDKKIITEAKILFKKNQSAKGNKQIRADIRSVVYGIVAQNGATKEWNEFKKLYDKEEMHEEKDRYARALTSFRDKTLLAKTLMFSLSKDVRDQDAPHLLAAVWSNILGRDLAWAFIKHNWPIILKKYGEGGHFLSRLLSPLGSHTRATDIADIKKFFSKNAAPGASRTLEQSYERIASNAAWLADDREKIKNWLIKNF